MNKLCVLLPLATLVLTVAAQVPAQQRADRLITLSSTFADGMLDGWESYPLAEDNGYDPSLLPSSDPNHAGIERLSTPLVNGCFHTGFIRPLHLLPAPSSTLSLQYQLPLPHPGAKIHVRFFAGESSKDYEAAAITGDWQSLRFNLNPPAGSSPWTAVAVFLDSPQEHTGIPVQFRVGTVSVTGRGKQLLSLASPDAIADLARQTYYLRTSIAQGGTIAASFVQTAVIELRRPDGSLASMGEKLNYRLAPTDPAGIWTIHAENSGAIAEAQVLVETSVRPGLLFDQLPTTSNELLDQIKARRDELSPTVHPELGPNIAQFNQEWFLPGLPSYFKLLVPPSELALYDAILYRYRHDPRDLDLARNLLRAMSSWPTWVHPWIAAHGQRTYYPVGLAAANLAIARAFLGDALTKEETDQLDHALLQRAIKPALDEYVLGNRLPFSVSNWIGNTVGGSLLAALTLTSNDSAGYILALHARDCEHLLAAYTSDGDYGEGTSYLRFDLEMTSLVAEAVERRLHKPIEPLIRHADRYLRNATFGTKELIDFGDTHTELTSTDAFAFLAARGTDQETKAFYRQYQSAVPEQPLLRLLWDEAALSGTVPEYHPHSTVFPLRGTALLRTSSAPSATIIAMRAGANFNHNHADQGSLQIVSHGKIVLGEAGYADYYKDPFYASYVIQAAGHNVLLVDENPLSQQWPGNPVAGAHPNFTANWLGTNIDVLGANLTSAYGGILSDYRRWVISPKSGPVVVVDRAASPSPHHFSLIWHSTEVPVPREVSPVLSYRLGPGVDAWRLTSYSSLPIHSTITLAPLPLADFQRAESEPIHRSSILSVGTMAESNHATFVTVLAAPDAQEPAAERFQASDDSISFESTHWQLKLWPAGEETPGLPQLVYRDDRTILLLGMQHWTDHQRAIDSHGSINVEWTRTEHGDSLQVETDADTSVSLSGFCLEALCNDCSTSTSVHAVNGVLSLPLHKGRQTWTLISHGIPEPQLSRIK